MNEEISKELYDKYNVKLNEERKQIEQVLARSENPVSNLEGKINHMIEMAGKLCVYWGSANYVVKQKLQYLLFPEGICYNRKTDQCRTNKINGVFLQILRWTQDFRNEKSGIPELNLDYAALVAGSRIELPTLGL
jgi:site-specific DNA recombinase